MRIVLNNNDGSDKYYLKRVNSHVTTEATTEWNQPLAKIADNKRLRYVTLLIEQLISTV